MRPFARCSAVPSSPCCASGTAGCGARRCCGDRCSELPLRACGCTFCRKHGARTTADPAGRVRITLSGEVSRYRWGLATAEFLVCARCGIYAGAVLHEGASAWAVFNTRSFDEQSPFQREAPAVDYEGETAQDRIARRKLLWTPAEII